MRAVLAFLLFLAIVGCGTSKPEKNVVTGDSAVSASSEVVQSADSGTSDSTEEEVSEVQEVVEQEEVADAEEVEAEAGPKTIAEQFVSAGGQKLCEAMIYALNPDWQVNSCSHRATADQRERCQRRLGPIVRYTQDLCRVSIEMGLYYSMDPVMGLSDMEQESSLGKRYYDREAYVYRINITDLCTMFLSSSRINCGLTGYRKCETDRRLNRTGAKWACWTFGDNNRENCQGVYELAVEDGGVKIDTCLYGEFGVFQLLPANYRAGTVIASTGEVLTGTKQEIERRLVHDVTLQIRLGYQELARHRDVAPESRREDWIDWLPIYNIGKDCRASGGGGCTDGQAQHWNVYLRNVTAHYLRACSGWFYAEDGFRVIQVKDVWPECERIKQIRDRLIDSIAYDD
jgi:hypothetical protein